MIISTYDVLPIYVFGDSHVLSLQGKILREKLAGGWFSTRAKYISGLTQNDFFNIETGEFHSEFIRALEYEGLIRNGKASHLSYEEIDFNILKARGQPVTSPLILLSAGDIDIRLILLPMLKDKYDFLPPFETPYLKSKKPLLLWDIVRQTIENRIKPFIEGIKCLRAAGFNRIYVQLVSPPTLSEEKFQQLHGYGCPVDVRYKAVFTFNQLLLENCKSNGVHVVDIWPLVTENNYLKSEHDLDGVHLHPDVSVLNLSLLLDHAMNHQWEATNYVRYEQYYRLATNEAAFNTSESSESKINLPGNKIVPAANVPPRNCTEKASKTTAQHSNSWVNDAVDAFQKNGLCILKTNPEVAGRWRESLVFGSDVGNVHSAWDWAGNQISPYTDSILTAIPPKKMLSELYDLLDQSEYDMFFKLILGCSIKVMNCRPVLSSPHNTEGVGPQSWHEDGCPAGVIRGVLYLTDVCEDTGPFQYKCSEGNPITVTGSAGDLLIFDAMRLCHRALPPNKKMRTALDLVFMPRLPHTALEVNYAGMNHWPADPFCFSIPSDKSSVRLGIESLSDLVLSNQITKYNNINSVEYNRLPIELLSTMKSQLNKLNNEILSIKNSKSWRMTSPLRSVMWFMHNLVQRN